MYLGYSRMHDPSVGFNLLVCSTLKWPHHEDFAVLGTGSRGARFEQTFRFSRAIDRDRQPHLLRYSRYS